QIKNINNPISDAHIVEFIKSFDISDKAIHEAMKERFEKELRFNWLNPKGEYERAQLNELAKKLGFEPEFKAALKDRIDKELKRPDLTGKNLDELMKIANDYELEQALKSRISSWKPKELPKDCMKVMDPYDLFSDFSSNNPQAMEWLT